MAFETVYKHKDFSIIYMGEGGGHFIAGGPYGRYYTRGGNIFMVESAAGGPQHKALLFEARRDVADRAGGFEINFDPAACVCQDKGALHEQGQITDAAGIKTYEDLTQTEKPAAILNRVKNSDGFFISDAGAMWHEARLYQLDDAGEVSCYYVLGYVPAADITLLDTCDGLKKLDYQRRDA